jgi:hypothetical protein
VKINGNSRRWGKAMGTEGKGDTKGRNTLAADFTSATFSCPVIVDLNLTRDPSRTSLIFTISASMTSISRTTFTSPSAAARLMLRDVLINFARAAKPRVDLEEVVGFLR